MKICSSTTTQFCSETLELTRSKTILSPILEKPSHTHTKVTDTKVNDIAHTINELITLCDLIQTNANQGREYHNEKALKITEKVLETLKKLQNTPTEEKKDQVVEKAKGKLKKIEQLNITCKNLKTLPSSFEYLSGLTDLILMSDQLKEVPNLKGFDRLKRLDISGNQITIIPRSLVTDLPNLIELKAFAMFIQSAPKELQDKSNISNMVRKWT